MDEDDMTFDQLREQMLAGRPAEIAPGPPPTISTASPLVIASSTLSVSVAPVSCGLSSIRARSVTKSWSAPRHVPAT